MEKELGKVEGVDLFIEDHGILTLYVSIKFGSSSQGFGGYALDSYSKKEDRRIGSACGTDFILRLLQLFDVNRLSEIKGKPVYALRETNGWNNPIIGLETPEFDGGKKFLIKDWQKRWFKEAIKED